MVTIRSTKGTPATEAQKSSGAMLTTFPISSPPAERPSHESAPGRVTPVSSSACAQSMKSVKVLRFCRYLPAASYHRWCPISPPPRMCAIA